eukprot:CAMPEP_0197457692 /NCGR_PEP_ID=MMETSP1175-20131217/46745_1 /TAXON_ID=1003142 /ORGANISM="Triceratium dubium, Strain CCMP147" /LENGTH=460 /DNA_ID=CAMNT_0042992127 /DNA_START=139 /DNA_END=1521 /DNA_ORIENTATION=+
MDKRRVDWGTVKSKSGRIDTCLSSYSSTPTTALRTDDSEGRSSEDDKSISHLDEMADVKEGKSLTKRDDFAEIGHDTDKTQVMQVSSRTLDEFQNENLSEETPQGVVGRSKEDDDAFSDNDNRPTPERRMSRRPSMEEVYEEMYKPAKVRCLRLRKVCGKVVNNHHFQLFIVLLIVINSIMMGLGTFDFVTENPDVSSVFEKVDLAFLITFTIELSMQLVYRGYKLFFDGWLVFDFIIVVMSWSLSSLQIIRAFRIFRALRLITRVQTLRKLVTALMDVIPNMTAIGLLLMLVFYIFAVMFTVLFKDLYELGATEEDYFSSLSKTLFTLFQMMTMDWSEPARQVMAVYPWAWAPFVLFVAVSGFMVFNLIIAVVCDAVAAVEHKDEDKEDEAADLEVESNTKEFYNERVQEMRESVDLLVQNQLQMQDLIQRIMEGMDDDAKRPTLSIERDEPNQQKSEK